MTAKLIEEFRSKLEKSIASDKARAGTALLISEKGPVGYSLLEALFKAVESQQAEIDELKRTTSGHVKQRA